MQKLFLAAALSGLVGCLDVYNRKNFWFQLKKERKASKFSLYAQKKKNSVSLKISQEDRLYQQLCASCHGKDGKGTSPMALAMKPSPKDFSDLVWQNRVDDNYLLKVIRDGGQAVGLSSAMPSWGRLLTEEKIHLIIKKIRSFKAS